MPNGGLVPALFLLAESFLEKRCVGLLLLEELVEDMTYSVV